LARLPLTSYPYKLPDGQQEKEKPVLTALVVLHIMAAFTLILFVLLHAGRGGGLSDMFGGGMGGGLGGSTAMERNLDRVTIVSATTFALTTVLLVLQLD